VILSINFTIFRERIYREIKPRFEIIKYKTKKNVKIYKTLTGPDKMIPDYFPDF